MDWTSDLQALRNELNSLRLERAELAIVDNAKYQERLAQLKEAFSSLQIEQLLNEMNRELLDGSGSVDIFAPWDPTQPFDDQEGDDDEDEEDEEADVYEVSAVLNWDEEGSCEVGVDLGLSQQGLYLRVNGGDIRLEADAICAALLGAFREEIGA